jgi:hypothetical protein
MGEKEGAPREGPGVWGEARTGEKAGNLKEGRGVWTCKRVKGYALCVAYKGGQRKANACTESQPSREGMRRYVGEGCTIICQHSTGGRDKGCII